MGHKGVSKRKPKGTNSKIKAPLSGQTPAVQGLVKKQNAAPDNGNTNSYIWENKKKKKEK